MSISVIIPAYNAASFIGETLRSVLAQTVSPDEILVIDDGSSDSTAEVARSISPRVRIIQQLNLQQSRARNTGAEQACGEWLAFIDADDLWAEDKLERQMRALAADPTADLCYTARTHFTDRDGKRSFGITIPVPPPAELGAALDRNTVFLPSSVVIRRSVFLASGGFDPHFGVLEDWDLWHRLLQAGCRFVACPEPLLFYRVRPGNLSRSALLALTLTQEIFHRHISPRYSGVARALRFRRIMSEHESEAAMILRSSGDPGYLAMMLRSVTRDPFHDPHRFKVLAHMLYTSTRLRLHPAAPASATTSL